MKSIKTAAADAFVLATRLSERRPLTIADKASETPGNAKTLHTAAVMREVPVAVSRAQVGWAIVPGTTARDAPSAIAGRSYASVSRVIGVTLVPAIVGPVPDVSVHVVKTPRIRTEAVDANGHLAPLSARAKDRRNGAVVIGGIG